jgi:hypothetical protein
MRGVPRRSPTTALSIAFVACIAVTGGACSSGNSVPRGRDGAADLASSSGGDTGTGGHLGGTGGGGSGTGGVGTGGTSSRTSAVDASTDSRTVKSGDPCRSQNDCMPAISLWLQCLAPGEFAGCGSCRGSTNECSTDADCAPDGGSAAGKQVCAAAASSYCYCTGVLICQPGCRTNADCSSGTACNAQHACQPTCTAGDGTCGADFACSSEGFCQQKSCTTDTDCSGACVKGKCYSTPGTCQPMVA